MKIYIECSDLSEHMGVVKAHIDEGINQVTMIDLELASQVEVKQDEQQKLIGKVITFYVEDVIDDVFHKVRWDGFIYEMIDVSNGKEDNGAFYYTMVVRPKMWMLNYSTHSRSYPEMSRIEVIDDLLKSHEFVEDVHYKKSYFKEDVYPKFNQLLQTGNSDLSFLKSLLINAGINYYFSCDDEAANAELLHLVDNNAFFPTVSEEIPIVDSGGMMQQSRRIREITRLTRAVPGDVKATAFLADGSPRPMAKSNKVEDAGTEGEVNIFVPEGLSDAELTAKQAGLVTSEGFNAARIVHQGVCDHIRVRPGKRLNLKSYETAASYRILVVKAHHTFEQTTLAALSETGSGDPAYKNFFQAIEPNAPIRPIDTWTDVDEQMTLDCAMDVDPDGKPTLSPKFKYVPRIRFNPDNDAGQNTDAIRELIASVAMLQGQVRTLRNKVQALDAAISANGSGFVAAEITKDAWVTDGCELVCMVKSEEFEDPIQVKTSAAWHDQGGGMLHLPRKGNHVWIQRVHRSKGNEWVIMGYRPTSAVASSNNPAKSFKIKKLG